MRRLRVPAIRVVHACVLARLRTEAWLAARWSGERPARIVVTAGWQFPIYAQTFVHQEAAALVSAGFEVRLFYGFQGPREDLAEACRGLWSVRRRVVINDTTGDVDFEYFRRRMPDKVAALTRMVAGAAGMSPDDLERHVHYRHAFSYARAVEAWRPDYLHSYFFYERTLYSLVASRLLDIPRGISCYADHVLQDYPLKLVPLHLRTCDVVVATSRRIRGELEAIHGGPLEAAVVKPNAIDTSSFPVRRARARRQMEPLVLTCVCRIDPKKGLEYLIEAMRLLRNEGRRIEAHILGAVETHLAARVAYDRELRAQVTREGLEGIVTFHGQCASRDVYARLRESDIFVAPFVELPDGDKDGIPTAILEAMATGCVVVATTAGSIGEVIEDGWNGLLVPQRDAAALAAAVKRLDADPALAGRLVVQAATLVRRDFDVRRSEQVFHDRIVGAVERRRGAGATADVRAVASVPAASAVAPTPAVRRPGSAHRRECGPGTATFVSVVIPAFNAEETIADTLHSVCGQTSPAWEAIVVDDGSSDRTGEIARELARREPRIRVISQQNLGEGGARNTGVAGARYDWLLFLDADDWIAPRHLERLTAAIQDDPSLDAVHCGSVRVAPDGTEVTDAYEPPTGDLFPTLAQRAAFPVHACLVRRSVVEEVGGFDPSLKACTDWDLWQRVARTGAAFGAVRDVLAYYRMRPLSASMKASQLLGDGLRVLARGHAPDPRVARPLATHAQGLPQDDMASQQYYLLSWCAGLAIGGGQTALPLLPLLHDMSCSGLYPKAIARCLYESAILPSCRTPDAWHEMWPAAAPLAKEFFEALERRSQTPGIGGRAMAELTAMVEATPRRSP